MLIFGAAMALPGPVAEAASCKVVNDADVRFLVGPSNYSITLSWTHSGFGSQQYVVERSDDSGGSWVTVQASTSKTYLDSSAISGISSGRLYRLSTAGCATSGPVLTYDPPDSIPGAVIYGNQDIY
jgi:hypothetical protein